MTCNECENSAKHKGTYNAHCVQCCAREVISARPSKMHQENMIDALIRFKGAPTRAAILAEIV